MTTPSNIDNLMTRAEVATLMRCSVDTVSRRIADGTLPASKVGRRVLIARADVAAMFAARVKAATRT